jgi:hypothetical protein
MHRPPLAKTETETVDAVLHYSYVKVSHVASWQVLVPEFQEHI